MSAIDRRSALRRLATAATGGAVAPQLALAQAATPAPEPPVKLRPPADPDLVNPVVPWDRVLSKDELATLAALCDVMLPADERSPAASKVGIPAFIDEWVSAPYPQQQDDCVLMRGGLVWLDAESGRRFGRRFVELPVGQAHQICDDLCDLRKAARQHRPGAIFFERLRTLAMGGYYSTLEGMKDIGYVGNIASLTFDGPPKDVLVRLKLSKT